MTDKVLPLFVGAGTVVLVLAAAFSSASRKEEAQQARVAKANGIDAQAIAQTGPFDLSALDADQQAAFGAQVRGYLLDNPQVIMEAVAVLEEREAAQQAQADVDLVAANAQALYDDGFSWEGGNPDGDVTVVEFLDYRCGFCRKAHPEVTELIESDGNIRLIVKELPILGDASMVSSRFAIATQIVSGDEAYEAIHNALVTLDGDPSPTALGRLASTLGLDADAIFAEMESEEVTSRISQTRDLAQQMQINGTPSFVMAGQMVRGYVPLDGMRSIVAEARGAN